MKIDEALELVSEELQGALEVARTDVLIAKNGLADARKAIFKAAKAARVTASRAAVSEARTAALDAYHQSLIDKGWVKKEVIRNGKPYVRYIPSSGIPEKAEEAAPEPVKRKASLKPAAAVDDTSKRKAAKRKR